MCSRKKHGAVLQSGRRAGGRLDARAGTRRTGQAARIAEGAGRALAALAATGPQARGPCVGMALADAALDFGDELVVGHRFDIGCVDRVAEMDVNYGAAREP